MKQRRMRLVKHDDEETSGRWIGNAWQRIERVLNRRASKVAATLAPPATEQEIAEVERVLKLTLPDDLKQSLRIHNGQIDPSQLCSFVQFYILLSTSQIIESWQMYTETDLRIRRENRDESPPLFLWWRTAWIPFARADGDVLCINCNPDSAKVGAVIEAPQAGCQVLVVANSYSEWLEAATNRLQRGRFTVEPEGWIRFRDLG